MLAFALEKHSNCEPRIVVKPEKKICSTVQLRHSFKWSCSTNTCQTAATGTAIALPGESGSTWQRPGFDVWVIEKTRAVEYLHGTSGNSRSPVGFYETLQIESRVIKQHGLLNASNHGQQNCRIPEWNFARSSPTAANAVIGLHVLFCRFNFSSIIYTYLLFTPGICTYESIRTDVVLTPAVELESNCSGHQIM